MLNVSSKLVSNNRHQAVVFPVFSPASDWTQQTSNSFHFPLSSPYAHVVKCISTIKTMKQDSLQNRLALRYSLLQTGWKQSPHKYQKFKKINWAVLPLMTNSLSEQNPGLPQVRIMFWSAWLSHMSSSAVFFWRRCLHSNFQTTQNSKLSCKCNNQMLILKFPMSALWPKLWSA